MYLGGGNSSITYFRSSLGKWSKLTSIFFTGLVQPPGRYPPFARVSTGHSNGLCLAGALRGGGQEVRQYDHALRV